MPVRLPSPNVTFTAGKATKYLRVVCRVHVFVLSSVHLSMCVCVCGLANVDSDDVLLMTVASMTILIRHIPGSHCLR